jgi:secretion/DNA translocation related TadE-like protein
MTRCRLRARAGHARGSISLVALAGGLVLCTLALGAADLGAMLLARARAQTAADAAALAAIAQQAAALTDGTQPEDAARDAAERNGATLARCECEPGTARATVDVTVRPHLVFVRAWFGREVRASAAAELDADVLTYRAPESRAPNGRAPNGHAAPRRERARAPPRG